jgi:DNA helicase-2/ATP-dependent DNA helicase PcrA
MQLLRFQNSGTVPLNEEQKNAVTYKNGPLLIIAGAGTGKTTVITTRIAWLILFNQIKPEEILALTFTDKAAEEMEERVDRLLPYGYVDLWISTFHSFAERILKQHAIDIGLPDNFKLLNQTEQNFLIRRNFDRFNLDYYRPLGNPTKFIQAMIKHFSRVKDEEIWPEDYLEYAEGLKLDRDIEMSNVKCQMSNANEIKRINEIANAYHVYQQLLLKNSALDFGDLINYTLKLFRTRPQILEKYRKQFKYILVDEFQDTNWAQYELIKLLGAPKNNITVSFDDDQSIYKFRGASVSNVMQFKKDYSKAKQIVLIKNYRSKQNILDLAYNFIQKNNPNRLEWQLKNNQ